MGMCFVSCRQLNDVVARGHLKPGMLNILHAARQMRKGTR
jgi:hypothetical protein